MNVDNYGWESSLSMVANEQTRTARPRHGSVPQLLRPVFMNAVEVGYSYAHCDRDKKLNVRGVTIALWHFICRGHQAIALLPYCFKNYAEKSSRYSELMMLYRLNLIEFTPGYGSEKYTEVNRIMVNRAYETGGCLVARSQMQGITDNKANLIDVVEQRLLMPTFNGDDIMFPIDGPLGRNGPSLEQTLQCEQGSPDWRSCSEHQLLLSDQRHWLEKLALLVPEKVIWTRMVQMIQAGGNENQNGGIFENEPPMPPSPPTIIPPLENPFHRSNRTSSNSSITNNNPSVQSDPCQLTPTPYHQSDPYNQNHHHSLHHHLSNSHQFHRQPYPPPRRFHGQGHAHLHQYGRHQPSTRLIIRYGSSPPKIVGAGRTTPSGNIHAPQRTQKHSATTDSLESTASTQSGEQENSIRSIDEDVARELNAQLIEETRIENEKRGKEEAEQKKKDEILAKLSQIFGYSKSIRVMSKFPRISTFSVLVEKCIHEPDQEGDGGEFADVWTKETVTNSGDVAEDIAEFVEDLIDFSDEPLPIQASFVEQEEHHHHHHEQGKNENNSNLVDLMF